MLWKWQVFDVTDDNNRFPVSPKFDDEEQADAWIEKHGEPGVLYEPSRVVEQAKA